MRLMRRETAGPAPIQGLDRACVAGGRLWLLTAVLMAACANRVTLADAFRVTDRIEDEQLQGMARMVQKRAGDALARVFYDRDGYMVRVEIGDMPAEQWRIWRVVEYVLDDKHLLREIRELKPTGEVDRKTTYSYSVSDAAIEMNPSVETAPGVEPTRRLKYVQKVGKDRQELLSLTLEPNGSIVGSHKYLYTGGLRVEALFMDSEGTPYQRERYDERGRVSVVEFLREPKMPGINSAKEWRYSYSGNRLFPDSLTAVLRDGTTWWTTAYEYELDAKGNWVEMRVYTVSEGGKTLREQDTQKRIIEYY